MVRHSSGQTCSQHRSHDGMKRSSPVFSFQPAKQLKNPKQLEDRKQFTSEELEETKASLRTLQAEEHAREEAARKATLRKDIRTYRKKLQREASLKGCTPERKKEIKAVLEDLRGLEEQEFGSELRKHPSARRPSARELGFATDAPSVGEILERATIQQGLRSKKPHLMLAKLAEQNPKKWGGVAEREEQAVKREAKHNPRIERTRKRIKYGEIKEVAGSKLSNVDREIAEHYFKSQRLRKPLRELSAEKASVEVLKLDVDISPDSFDRALRRLALVG